MTPREKRYREELSAERRNQNEQEDEDLLQFFPTPVKAVKALLSRVPFDGLILEPACGKGSISSVLKAPPYNYEVQSSDLGNHDYGEKEIDFFTLKEPVPNIITNPPYGEIPRWIRHCLRLITKKVALLLPLDNLAGVTRYSIYKTSPPKLVLVFVRHLSFKETGETLKRECAWFVWEKGYKGKPQVEWIE